MDFKFTVVELPEIEVAGLTVVTTMENAKLDCPALWQTFAPRICDEWAGGGDISKVGESYGISKMIDDNRFTYWAAVNINRINHLADDFKTMTIAAGAYVKATVPRLENLAEALMAMYCQWPQSQSEYQIDRQGICFELYKSNWQVCDALEIYAAVMKSI